MIDLEVPLPPGKERFYVPTKLVDQGDLFGCEIKATGGNPVGFASDRIADQAQRGLRLTAPSTETSTNRFDSNGIGGLTFYGSIIRKI